LARFLLDDDVGRPGIPGTFSAVRVGTMDLEEDEDDEDDEEDDNNDDDEEEDDDNNNDDEDDEDDKRERKAGTRCPRPWLLDASDEGRVEAADSRLNREEVREGAFLLRPSNSK